LDDAVRQATFLYSTSVDFFLDNGQNAILSIGNFLYLAAIANSTMDFFAKPVDDSVVDSPPNEAPCLPKSYSLLPLRPSNSLTSRMLPLVSKRVMERKLYEDIGLPVSMTMMKSLASQEPIEEKICPSSHGPLLLHPRVRTLGVRMTKIQDRGVSPNRCASILFNASDQKFIQLQRLQTLREYKKNDNGYS